MPGDTLATAPSMAAAEWLEPVIFSTEGVPPGERLERWRANYESFNRILVSGPAADDFAARNEIWTLGSLAVMRNIGPPMEFERGACHIRRDSVDHWVVRNGRARFRTGEVTHVSRPLVPVLFSLGEPFDGERGSAEWISLYIPRDAFPELSGGLGLLGPGPIESQGGQLLADYVLALERRLPAMPRSQVPMLMQATRSMVAACLLTGIDPRAVSAEDAATAQLERVRGIVRQNIVSPTLGPDKICRLAGMSRSQLYRLFEPHGGVARYMQAVRLRMAHAMLADPAAARLPISTVADRTGFYDASAFTRVFRREFGYTPSEARIAVATGAMPASMAGDAPSSGSGENFGALLRQLGGSRRPGIATPASAG